MKGYNKDYTHKDDTKITHHQQQQQQTTVEHITSYYIQATVIIIMVWMSTAQATNVRTLNRHPPPVYHVCKGSGRHFNNENVSPFLNSDQSAYAAKSLNPKSFYWLDVCPERQITLKGHRHGFFW